MSKQLERIGLVAGTTMVSRVLGLVRDMLTAAVFGTTALASAFYTAFTLPNLFTGCWARGRSRRRSCRRSTRNSSSGSGRARSPS